MKSEKWVTAGVAGILAFFLSLGAVGCMITAFELPLKSGPAVVLACAASAVFCSAAFCWKRGGIAVLLLAALLAGYLWRRCQAAEPFLQLIDRLSHVYDQAYGWGVLQLTDTPWDAGIADLPMGILGAAIAAVTAWTVCRGESAIFAVAPSLLPLFSCLVVTDTVPDPVFLFLLLFGVILLLLTSRVRSGNPSQGNRLTILTAVPTALALGILFLAVPREGYVNQSAAFRDNMLTWFAGLSETVENTVQEAASGAQSSAPEHVDLASLGRRIESTVPIMDITAEVGGTLYLRGQDYDVYDGTGWTATPTRVEDFSCQGIDLGSVTIQTRNKLDQLYLPYYPEDGQSLVAGRIDNTRLYTQYSFRRTGLPDNWRATAVSGETGSLPFASEAEQIRQRYQVLPEDTRSGAEALLDTIPQGPTITEKAEAIGNFVRSCARYDKNTARMPSGEEDFALWFLESAETGYCVHFATAAVVLLRTAGIEARYVSGYTVRAQSGETVAVTGENAHAWAEYYEPALDTWLILEATPADTNALTEPPRETPETVPVTQAPSQPAETLPKPSTGTEQPTESAAPVQKRAPGWLGSLLKMLLLLAVAAGFLEGQRRIRIRLRRRRQRKGTPNAQALARWQEAERLAKLLKEPPPPELDALAQKAKFSQHTLMAEELTSFDSFLRTAKKKLRQKPWYTRLLYQYIFAVY